MRVWTTLRVVLLAAATLAPATAVAGPSDWLVRAGSAVKGQLGVDKPRVVRRSIDVKDVSLKTLKQRLGWLGIEIPLDLQGDVTAKLTAQVDLSSLRDAKSYQIDGTLSSKKLVAEGLKLEALAATVRYRAGVLTLEQLTVAVPDARPAQPAGRAAGTARLQLVPAGSLTAELTLNRVPLEQFSRKIAAAAPLSGGRLNGKLDVAAPVAKAGDLTTWRGSGNLVLAELTAAGRTLSTANATVKLASGTLTLAKLVATLEGEDITGSGTLGLVAPYKYGVRLGVPQGKLSRLPALAQQELPGDFTGDYVLTAQAGGSLSPFTLDAVGGLTGRDWTLAGVAVPEFTADVRSNGKSVRLSKLAVTALGGRWTGTAQAALAAPYAFDSKLDLAGLNLAAIAQLPPGLRPPVPLTGTAKAKFTAAGTAAPQTLKAEGELSIDGPSVGGAAYDSLRLVGSATETRAQLTTLELIGGDGRLTGTASVGLTGDRDFTAKLQPQNFDLSRLGPLVGALTGTANPQAVAAKPQAGTPQAGTQPVAFQEGPPLAGRVDGAVSAQGQATPLKIESINGSLSGDNLSLLGVLFNRAELAVATQNRVLTLSKLLLTAGEGRLTGNATVGLDAPHAFAATLQPQAFRLEVLNPLFAADGLLPATLPPISGPLTGEVTVKGEAQPFKLGSANGTITGENLTVGRLNINRMEVLAATADGTLNISRLLVGLGDNGRVTGTATVGLEDTHTFQASLTLAALRLEAFNPLFGPEGFIQAELPPISGPLDGQANVAGQATPFRLDTAQGSLKGNAIQLGGLTVDRLELAAATQNDTLRVTQFLIAVGQGQLSGTAAVGLKDSHTFQASLTLAALRLEAFNPLFGPDGFIKTELPPISGPLNGQANVAGQATPFRLDDAQLSLSGENLQVGPLAVPRLEVTGATQGPAFQLNKLLVDLAEAGRITGQATLGLQDAHDFTAAVQLDALRLEAFEPLFGPGRLIATPFPAVRGTLSGEMTAGGRATPLALQRVDGRISSETLVANDVPFQRLLVVVETVAGQAKLSQLLAATPIGTLTGSGTVGLATPFAYDANLTFDEFDLAKIGDVTAGITAVQQPDVETPAQAAPGPGVLPVQLTGLVKLLAHPHGTLSPFLLEADGTAAAPTVTLDARDIAAVAKPATLSDLTFAYAYGKDGLTLDKLSAGLAGGTLGGSATMPFAEETPGTLDFHLKDVVFDQLLTLPLGLGGVASADAQATLGPVADDGTRPVTAHLKAALPKLTAGGQTIGDVTADLTVAERKLTYTIAGTVFEGNLTADGTLAQSTGEAADLPVAGSGSLRLTALNLARATVLAGTAAPNLAGILDASLSYDTAADTKAQGTLELRDLRLDNALVTDGMRVEVVWTDGLIRLENIGGGLADGRIGVRLSLAANNPGRGELELTLRRADVAKLVAWVPDLAGKATGTIDLYLSARLRDLYRWQGRAEIARGSVGILEFQQWKIPLQIDASPNRGAIYVDAQRTSLQAARGRGNLDATLALGANRVQVAFDGNFQGMQTGSLLGDLGKKLPGGQVTGTFKFASRNFRGLADLEGKLNATLKGGKTQGLPVIDDVGRIAGLPAGGLIDKGEVVANLGGGVARLSKFTITGKNFALFAEGTIALASWRLALDVVVDNSPQRQDRVLAEILLRQFVENATPLGALARANRLLAERAAYLRVTGTLARPIIRVRPAEQLQQTTLRFFLGTLVAP